MTKIKLLYDIEQLLVSKGKETGICRVSLEILKQNKEGTKDLMNSRYSIMLYDKYFDFVVPYFYDNIGSVKPTMIDMMFNSYHFEIFM